MTDTTAALVQPGIYPGMPIEDYFAADAVSQSFLWDLYRRTPAHARYGKRQESRAFDMGQAIHTAILEPDRLDERVMRGPDDRRGNKWKDAQADADLAGKLLLTSGDHDAALAVRDTMAADPFVTSLISHPAAQIEHSAFAPDEGTGAMCRARFDLYRPDLRIGLDLKSAASAAAREFQGSVAKYGYHVQEAHYREVWPAAGGGDVDGFVFLVIEKTPPYAHAIYELRPEAVEEGRLIRRRALQTYAECMRTGDWPGYHRGVLPLDLPRWAYTEIAAQAEAAE